MHEVAGFIAHEVFDTTTHDVEKTLIDRVYERIRSVSAYRVEDLAIMRPSDMNHRDWRLVVHAAEERLLGEGVVFSPLKGLRRKATTVAQVAGREGRFARAGLRKLERAVKLAAAAAPMAEDDQERRRVETRELKRSNAVVDAKSALRGAGMKRPKGV